MDEDTLLGGLYGLLIGDALGVPYEFHRREEIPDAVDMTPPEGFRRSHALVPPGTWSDDGAQALCLLASLLARGRLDVADFGRRLVDWRYKGYMAVDGVVFDVGSQTHSALSAIERGAPALRAAPNGVQTNGNGSLMRCLPLALWHTGPDHELVRDAHLQSRVTHPHERSQVCCALYVLWARSVLEGGLKLQAVGPRLGDAYRKLRVGTSLLDEAESVIGTSIEPSGSGYVVDCLRTSAVCVESSVSYREAVVKAVKFGRDTDTTACVTGGIAGLISGLSGIPEEWFAALRGKELVAPLADRLLKRYPGCTW